jgi:photosystem II stability/assembly factor-like uncharacterized protein
MLYQISSLKIRLLPILASLLFFASCQTNDPRKEHGEFLAGISEKGELEYSQDEPKPTRPDLAALQNFHQTVDPNLQRVPAERTFMAYNQVKKEEAQNANKTLNSWEAVPTRMGGRMRGIMWDPNDGDGNKVWGCAVTGGLWYNNDISDEDSPWQTVSDLWPNLVTNCITYDPNNPQIFYLGTGEYHTARVTYRESSGVGVGIWKTEDGGETWELMPSTSDFKYISDIAVRDEDGQSVIYAGVVSGMYWGEQNSSPSEGLYRSTDGGETWTQVLPNVEETDLPYAPADIELASNGRLFIGTLKNVDGEGGATILYSDDGTPGSWQVYNEYREFIEGFIENNVPGRIVLSASEGNPNIVYAVVSSGYYNSFGFNLSRGMFVIRSSDGGANWQELDEPPTEPNHWASLAWHAFVVKAHPSDTTRALVGGLDLFTTNNIGEDWNKVSYWNLMNTGGGDAYAHADQHWILPKPGDPDISIFSTDGGVFYSENAWDSDPVFQERSKSLNTLQFYTADVNRVTTDDYFAGGTQDNGTLLYTGDELWLDAMILGGDGAYTHFIDNGLGNIVTSTQWLNLFFHSNFNYVSSFGESGRGVFINPSEIDQTENILFANKATFSGTNSNQIYLVRNIPNNPYTLTSTLNTGLNTYFSALAASPHSPDGISTLFIASANGKLFRVDNAHLPTETTTDIGSDDFPIGYISSIAIGGSEDTLMVTFSNFGVPSVWETYNGGESWTDVSGNLPDMPIRWALYHPEGSNEVLLATELGVWYSNNTQEGVWERDEGLPMVRVDMLKIRPQDNTVIAATHGRGLQYTTWNQNTTDNIDEFNAVAIQVYPNPSNGLFRLTDGVQILELEVYNLDGQIVHQSQQPLSEIDLTAQKPGTYLIKAATDRGVITQKLVIQ